MTENKLIKESFLDRQPTINISELLSSIIVAIDNNDSSCWRTRVDHLISTISKIAVYQKEMNKISITAESFEKNLELETLISYLQEDSAIKDEDIKTEINTYLHSVPGLYKASQKSFTINDIAEEQHDFVSRKIRYAMTVIKQLDSRMY